MEINVSKKSESEVIKQYPIAGHLDGWYFRLTETSNNAWLAEGTDLWGHKVACRGGDENQLLSECINMAKNLGSSQGM